MAILTTITAVRRQLFGNDQVAESDQILTTLMASSSAWVEQRIGGDLMTGTKTETFDGDGGTRVRLTRSHSWRPGCPATTITSVTVDGMAIPARSAVSTLDTNPSGYVCRGDCVDLVGYTFTVGVANVVIVYVAGYATVPTEVEQAVLEHVALRYKDRGHAGVDSSSGGEGSVSYGNAGTLAYLEGALEPYSVMGHA